ncbi:MAG: endolytic transglycosylase MltG [Christensenellales bacterium]|nr:endolytic transglycosylase MltG [Clostridiales bacterium]
MNRAEKKQRRNQARERLFREREYGLYWYSWLWSIIRPVLVFICALILLAGVISTGIRIAKGKWIDPVNPKDTQEITFLVESGDSLSRVSQNLEKQNLVRSGAFFKYYADFSGFSQKIQAGEYTLSRSMNLSEILDQLTMGDGIPTVQTITVIPGWTVDDIADYLVKQGLIERSEEWTELCKHSDRYAAYYYISDVLTQGYPAQRKYVLEGYLAPDTYEVYVTATADDIIKKLLSQTETVFTQSMRERAEQLNMTMDDVITLASMIEKEAKTKDFAKVSAVFHNRLKKGMTLGSDVTIKYVLGTKRMVLNQGDLSVSSPYNTYQNKGLPVGPICNPSKAAMEAALYPDEQFLQEQVLYFCSTNPDSGDLHFSKTLKEHEQAVAVYSPLWAAFDAKEGHQ